MHLVFVGTFLSFREFPFLVSNKLEMTPSFGHNSTLTAQIRSETIQTSSTGKQFIELFLHLCMQAKYT